MYRQSRVEAPSNVEAMFLSVNKYDGLQDGSTCLVTQIGTTDSVLYKMRGGRWNRDSIPINEVASEMKAQPTGQMMLF